MVTVVHAERASSCNLHVAHHRPVYILQINKTGCTAAAFFTRLSTSRLKHYTGGLLPR